MTTKRLIGTDADQIPRNADLGSMAFQNADGVNVGTLQVTNKLLIPGGSTSDTGLSFVGDVNTGIHSPAADQISLVAGGSTRLLTTTSGVTLYGTTTLGGNINAANFSITSVGSLQINDPGPGEGIIWTGGTGWQIYESPNDLITNSAGNLQVAIGTGAGGTRVATFLTTGVEVPGALTVGGNLIVDTNTLVVDAVNNRVAIGASSTDVKLLVSDTTQNLQMRIGSVTAGLIPTVRMQTQTTSGSANRFADIKLDPDNNTLTFMAPNTTAPTINALNINNLGNIGVGTVAPLAVGSRTTVEIKGTSGAAIRLSDDTANAYLDYTDGSGTRLAVNAAEPLVFQTNSLDRMIINSSGNVTIGASEAVDRGGLAVSRANSTAYTATSASLFSPISASSAALSIINTAALNDSASFVEFIAKNTGGSNAYGYVGYVARNGTTLGDFVFGRRTASTAYAEHLKILGTDGSLVLGGDDEHYIGRSTTSAILGTTVDTTVIRGRQIDLYSYDSIYLRSGAGAADKAVVITPNTETSFHVNGEFQRRRTDVTVGTESYLLRRDVAATNTSHNVIITFPAATSYAFSGKLQLVAYNSFTGVSSSTGIFVNFSCFQTSGNAVGIDIGQFEVVGPLATAASISSITNVSTSTGTNIVRVVITTTSSASGNIVLGGELVLAGAATVATMPTVTFA